MADVKHIEAVRIIYDDNNRIFFNFFAELYRLIGLYVEEVSLEESKEILKGKSADEYILSLYIADPILLNKDIFYIKPYQLGKWDMSYYDDKFLEAVASIIKDLRRWSLDHGLSLPFDLMEEILPIYIKNNIPKGAMQLQYYRMKTEIHQETEHIFLMALSELDSLNTKSQYLTYAKLYCKQKANLSCYFQEEKPLHFAISTLVEECDALIEHYPDFSNAKALKGMICEKSSDGLKLAIDSYRDALQQIGNKSYASNIYHWVGLLYEKFINSHKDAAYAYGQSYLLKRRYRNTYKMGFMAEQEGDYQRAVFYYKECIDFLEQKVVGNMDPLEIEYYFKTGVLICFHSQRFLEDYAQTIRYGKKMMDFYEGEFLSKPNKHFKYLYGSEAEKYQTVSEKRLKRKRLYECLAIACRELGDREESMRYWNLSEEIITKG